MKTQTFKNYLLRIYTSLLVISVIFLIFVGSLVTSTGTGLSVPDWPTTYGHFMFSFPLSQMVGGIFYEHGHRMLASCIGAMTVGLLVIALIKDKRVWVKKLAGIAVFLVCLQGLLGGLTVLFYLPDAISVSHAFLAQTFLCVTVLCAYIQSREYFNKSEDKNRITMSSLISKKSLQVQVWLVGAIFGQLLLGAIMRHTGSGLAMPDFPTFSGSWLPMITDKTLSFVNAFRFDHLMDPVTKWQMFFHLAHRLGAVVVLVLQLRAFKILWHDEYLSISHKRHLLLLLFIVFMQILLGILTVLSLKLFWIASLHVAFGATYLALTFLLLLRISPASYSHFKKILCQKS